MPTCLRKGTQSGYGVARGDQEDQESVAVQCLLCRDSSNPLRVLGFSLVLEVHPPARPPVFSPGMRRGDGWSAVAEC